MNAPGRPCPDVGLIDVFDFKSNAVLKRHAKDYTRGRGGVGYVWRGMTLIVAYPYLPPGFEDAFVAAMNDLGAKRKYVTKVWREEVKKTKQ